MKLLIQPGAGPEALLAGIRNAKKSIEIAIFRFDRKDVELALKAAAAKVEAPVPAEARPAADETAEEVAEAQPEAARAARGGESGAVSSLAIHNVMLEEAPEHLAAQSVVSFVLPR